GDIQQTLGFGERGTDLADGILSAPLERSSRHRPPLEQITAFSGKRHSQARIAPQQRQLSLDVEGIVGSHAVCAEDQLTSRRPPGLDGRKKTELKLRKGTIGQYPP